MKKCALFLATILLITMSTVPVTAKPKKPLATSSITSVSKSDAELDSMYKELDRANNSLLQKMKKLDKAEAKLVKTKKAYKKAKKAKVKKKVFVKKKLAYYTAKDNAKIARQAVDRQRGDISDMERKIHDYLYVKNALSI